VPLPVISDRELLSIEKPAQYLGGELNSIIKQDSEVNVHFALAFPDVYEVGMSHLGIQLLYSILNSYSDVWAERCFMPHFDMEAVMRKNGAPLTSLESHRPVNNFDVLGFSLQYELCATNILAMLDLAGIPLYSKERTATDTLVIGGGPYSYHPEPIADFFDAFFLGDAEEALREIVDVIDHWKKERQAKLEAGELLPENFREQLLQDLNKIEGIYIPSFFSPNYNDQHELQSITTITPEKARVVRRLLPSMAGAPYPRKLIVPNITTVHNRLSMEVMRGCVRGCRFCQAGYLYRPQRERDPKEILQIIEEALPETGFEEISLLSLSTADYCSIVPLLKSLNDKYGDGDRVEISFPSTRVDALVPEVLEQVQTAHRKSFTVAPEAGTQRLRDVINKGVSDEQIIKTCSNVFTMGWTGVKLYFMLGLPTETDEDLLGIIELARRVKALPEAQGKSITVSVSTHVPKPHTPFQWSAQISIAETVRKQKLLAQGLSKLRVNFRYHDAFSSFLEGIFCRGGRELSVAIEKAYRLGCRLDAWQEYTNQELWTQAFIETEIDPVVYLRERSVDEVLPWEHLSCGISKEYFAKEYKRALKERPTPDCLKTSCSICGACNYDVARNVLWSRESSEIKLKTAELPGTENTALAATLNPPLTAKSQLRVRVGYSKSGVFQYVGHLELMHVFHRAVRRAGLPVAYSQGFNPLPRIAFGPPLQLGIQSQHEFADFYLASKLEPQLLLEFLNQTLPQGLQITSAHQVDVHAASLQQDALEQHFEVTWLKNPGGVFGGVFAEEFANDTKDESSKFHAAVIKSVVNRPGKFKNNRNKSSAKTFPLAQYLSHFSWDNSDLKTFKFGLKTDSGTAGPKPLEVVKTLSGLDIGEFKIAKLKTIFAATDENVSPLSSNLA